MTILKTAHVDRFQDRHIGPDDAEIEAMLQAVGFKTLDDLVDATVPASIRLRRPLELPRGRSELGQLAELEEIAKKNDVWRSYIGMGYHGTFTPPVILRNVLLNPGWYTQYTPYQAEISQGRLEALLNFQTMVMDLTGLEIANASLLDEGTAAAEAMTMAWAAGRHHRAGEAGPWGSGGEAPGNHAKHFFVADDCHPQTIDVVRTRAKALGIEVAVGDPEAFEWAKKPFGALYQYPATDGAIRDLKPLIQKAHDAGALAIVAADILALTMLTPPGELGADVAIGSTQRFGVPMGYGGPHAAYFATKREFVRQMPGRVIGVAEDANGRPALRMALQTREQHIRREKATSNICTAQVLLAVMASMYAVYHGPRGLRAIAERVHTLAGLLAKGVARLGFEVGPDRFFDTFYVRTARKTEGVLAAAAKKKMNFRQLDADRIAITLDEITTPNDVEEILSCFAAQTPSIEQLEKHGLDPWPENLKRKSAYLTHPVFNTHRSETDMQRYIRQLEGRDLSLTHSMIPLGSCTMKLNAASEMEAVTWKAFNALHPFAPREQARGYDRIFADLEKWLAEITGFAAISLQPNAGSQGEYAGLLVIRAYQESRGQKDRKICLIPSSAHGTNPASAVMAGYEVVVVACDEQGNIDLADLEKQAKAHAKDLAALMVTYPSTHGVFEEGIQKACEIVHANGGQVYMDGANLNAMVGLTRPADIGADVCHANLHKTMAIPHGGGGPGMGPIGVAKHLVEFLPGNPVIETGGKKGIGAISSAPWGSASILLISWGYISMLGGDGVTRATKVAILNANYVAKRLQPHFPLLYAGKNGTVAHECILDTRQLKKTAGIEVEDIAKRLMDYGFHAPTISFPVAGTVMIEPTESESKAELDRFIDAMISIRREIADIESGKQPRENNLLKNAPHTSDVVTANDWKRPYAREQAAFPAPWVKARKFWPSVSRINAAAGDRHLVCSCPPIESYQKAG